MVHAFEGDRRARGCPAGIADGRREETAIAAASKGGATSLAYRSKSSWWGRVWEPGAGADFGQACTFQQRGLIVSAPFIYLQNRPAKSIYLLCRAGRRG